jgi:excisionase family DNA binding protein
MQVAVSTVRRWIRQGELPAYRVGQRRLVIRRDDLASLIQPIRPAEDRNGVHTSDESGRIRPLTSEEQEQGLAAMWRAELLAAQIRERRGGELLSSSIEILDEMRDEREQRLT